MRITNSILALEAMSGIQSQMRGLQDAQRRVSTGLEVERPSDDPVAAAGILQSSSGLRALEQYRSNLETGQARLAVEESVLDQLSVALTRAKEISVSQVNDSNDAEARARASQEIGELLEHVRALANTKFQGSYVFGGQYSDTAPYQGTVTDPTRPPSGTARIEIGSGVLAETNHAAQEIFLDSDLVDGLEALRVSLNTNDVPALQASMDRLDVAFDTVQELTSEVGARTNRLDVAVTNLDSLDVTLQTFRSDLGDADLAEAVADLVNRQGALEAAMLATSRIMNTTLSNYLR